jgi:general secretion pathway protein B
MRKVYAISELQPGMMVSKVITQNGPVKIRKVGMIRSAEMIKGLKEMGVSELEVDLEQSIGIETPQTSDEDTPEITPTQQLLRDERQVAQANPDINQHYHRSLFMPSVETLPSPWRLYGKNLSILTLLVVGGACLGWNIAHVGQWISLAQTKEYVQVEVPPISINTVKATEREARAKVSQQSAEDSTSVVKVEEPPPIILGYRPEEELDASELQDLVSNEDGEVLGQTSSQTSSEVSSELLKRVNSAIVEIDKSPEDVEPEDDEPDLSNLPRIDQLSIATQTEIPSMQFNAHFYSSQRVNRWVRVNGRKLVEGDFIAEDLQILNIEPQTVVLSFKDEVFTMNAMTDW